MFLFLFLDCIHLKCQCLVGRGKVLYAETLKSLPCGQRVNGNGVVLTP